MLLLVSTDQMPVSVDALSPRVQGIYQQVKDMIEQYVLPLEAEILEQGHHMDNHWVVHPRMEELKVC